MKLYTENYTHDVEITRRGVMIDIDSGYHPELVEEIKRLDRARWNGSVWSMPANAHNRYALGVMTGTQGGAYLDPTEPVEFKRDYLRPSQQEMVVWGANKRCCGWAAFMRTGKTLSYIEMIERHPDWDWWIVAPKRVIAALKVEFDKWGFTFHGQLMTYHKFTKLVGEGHTPRGVIYDEISHLKGPTSQRTKAGIALAERMDETWDDCIRIGGTGTPQPKNYLDWWAMSEVLNPGWLPWGNIYKMEEFLAIRELQTGLQGQQFWSRVQWKDGSECVKCSGRGWYPHKRQPECQVPCQNCDETGNVPDNVKTFLEWVHGMWIVILKDPTLPPREVVPIYLEPSATLKRVAEAITDQGLSSIQVQSKHRQLSDGFIYQKDPVLDEDGMNVLDSKGKPKYKLRTVRGKKSPKIQAYLRLLDDHHFTGRFCVTAAYTAAIDWLCEASEKAGWRVIRCDGKGFKALWDSTLTDVDCLKLFGDREEAQSGTKPIVIVGHPKSLGYGTDLSASCGFCFFSNDFDGESFMQMIERGHSQEMDMELGCTLYFLFHLPTDSHSLVNLLRKKRAQDVSTTELRTLYTGTYVEPTQQELQALLEEFSAAPGSVHQK